MKIINTGIINKNAYIAIIITRYNIMINKNLLKASLDIFKRLGHIPDENITIIWVPGSYELSYTTQLLIKKNIYDGIMVIGTIIKGITSHYKYLTQEIYTQISSLSILNQIPIVLCVLSTDNLEQALNRSNGKQGNKGIESALTLLEMINISKEITLL
ncbi:6,7-dimethyl-8-ribityllumazine synthase [Enterobacteriaceae endosymbiont of Macroplea appendiculata]|uniref:6,7-dimethyl-8-ribityllumazine synthase n=1 Tax=Enterobacteriaceae endosymbiont of Macroplea appendiculata TaxID=2675790 RepID=UPI0014491256|nr:6,7-dimethyl-8-ribityllumazine synthase [Enterobacteriaceae endosymbiont of Macroplea appendiculata]QJC30674.1 6,7-dimethyl-8-ribityllumazine synthase [Enterobacteriaceae endosymbiont of Macroplea appendiculata]